MLFYVKSVNWRKLVSAGIDNNYVFPNLRNATLKILGIIYIDFLKVMCTSTFLKKYKKHSKSVERVMSMRVWEHVNSQSAKPGFVFTLMSYNVLAQDLLDKHPYLYLQHNKKALEWETRWNNLMIEIKKFYPDIICLQEVQESHIKAYYSKLESLGYYGVYKKRTGIRTDGCAIYYKDDTIKLIDHLTVNFFTPEVPLLNRDNVGIIAKFAPKYHPKKEFVVATTHLLYNPRRNDVRHAQMQLFLAKIDSISFQKQFGKSSHIPVIITGDLNTQPDTELYHLITSGNIDYKNFLCDLRNKHSDDPNLIPSRSVSCHQVDVIKNQFDQVALPNLDKNSCTTSDYDSLPFSYERECLTEKFSFRSAYDHGQGANGEATTFQDEWVTVDYIFYSVRRNKNKSEDKLKLLSRWKLPSVGDLQNVSIPNSQIGSDHLCLITKFKLEF